MPVQRVHGSEGLVYTASIAGVEFGIDAAQVEGTFEIVRIAPVHGASSDVLGLHTWKGAPLPVLDPRPHLGMLPRGGETANQGAAVVVQLGGAHVAIAFDSVRGPLVYSRSARQMLDFISLFDDHALPRAPDVWADLRAALWKHASYAISDVNIAWVTRRYRSAQWGRVLPSTQKLAAEFLAGFGSPCVDTLWNEKLRARMNALLHGSSTRQFAIWNHGRGRGFDALSLACILAVDRPRLRVKIWAVDELAAIVVAQDPSLSRSDVPEYLKGSGLLVEEGGRFSATDAVLERIVLVSSDAFVPFPGSFDMIVCRDRLSYLDAHAQTAAIAAFKRALRPKGTLITGVHEKMPASDWSAQPHAHLPSWKIRRIPARPFNSTEYRGSVVLTLRLPIG
jgi:chemotaxis methyl-accepting protein methylase